MTRVISASLSPNTETDDVLTAWFVLFRPHIWTRGVTLDAVTRWFRERYHPLSFFTFSSGRVALYALLHALNIKKGDEVIMQAFTCVAVPNSIRWAGATPIYADIDASYNLSPSDVEKKITNKTKAIIVQHTFGITANIEELMRLAKAHDLLLIEDCAHALGAEFHGKKVGAIGHAAFFSFGRDKALSSVWGGAAMINRSCSVMNASEKLKKFHTSLPDPSLWWTFQQLMHPISFSIILPLYKSGVGKIILVVLQKLSMLSYPVFPEEKMGKMPRILLSKYPNGLSVLLLRQLKKLPKFMKRRKESTDKIVSTFMGHTEVSLPEIPEGSVPLRYPLLVSEPKAILRKAKRHTILLGNWYRNIIDPEGVNMRITGYVGGSCPIAEEKSKHVVNIPTLVSNSQLERVLRVFRTIYQWE